MTDAEFADGLDQWGGDLTLWPADQRPAADRLLAASAPARAELQAMQSVEQALCRTAAASVASATGPDRLFAHAVAASQERPAGYRRIPARRSCAFAAAILAAGFLVGAVRPAMSRMAPADWFATAFATPNDLTEPADVD